MPGNLSGGQFADLLFYDPSAGVGEFYTTDGQGNISLLKSYNNWRPSWSVIMAGNLTGGQFDDLLFYDPSAKVAELYATDGQGNITLLQGYDMSGRNLASILTVPVIQVG